MHVLALASSPAQAYNVSMAKQTALDRYVTAGMDFTRMTRKRAETLVRDLVKEGAVGREHASDWAEDLLARSRRSAEHLSEVVSKEVKRQIDQLGLVKADDVQKLVERFVRSARSASEHTMTTVTKRADKARRLGEDEVAKARKEAESVLTTARERVQTATKPGPRRKAPARKAPAKRTAAAAGASKRATVAAVKKAPARKATARKATARKAPGGTSTASRNGRTPTA